MHLPLSQHRNGTIDHGSALFWSRNAPFGGRGRRWGGLPNWVEKRRPENRAPLHSPLLSSMLRLCAARRAFAVIRGRSRAPLPPPHPPPPPHTLPPSPHASPAARQSPRARAAAGNLQARDRVCPFLGITGVVRILWLIHPVNCVRPAYSPGTRLERDGRAARGGPLHLAGLWHLCHPRSSSTMTDTLFSSSPLSLSSLSLTRTAPAGGHHARGCGNGRVVQL